MILIIISHQQSFMKLVSTILVFKIPFLKFLMVIKAKGSWRHEPRRGVNVLVAKEHSSTENIGLLRPCIFQQIMRKQTC